MNKKQSHTGPHKYHRINIAKSKRDPYLVYKCALSNCTHFLTPALVVGNLTLCWRCGDEVEMSTYMAKRKKPLCFNCTGKADEATDVLSILRES